MRSHKRLIAWWLFFLFMFWSARIHLTFSPDSWPGSGWGNSWGKWHVYWDKTPPNTSQLLGYYNNVIEFGLLYVGTSDGQIWCYNYTHYDWDVEPSLPERARQEWHPLRYLPYMPYYWPERVPCEIVDAGWGYINERNAGRPLSKAYFALLTDGRVMISVRPFDDREIFNSHALAIILATGLFVIIEGTRWLRLIIIGEARNLKRPNLKVCLVLAFLSIVVSWVATILLP